MRNLIIDSEHADEIIPLREGEVVYFPDSGQIMRVCKLYEYREFGTYVVFDSTSTSFGFAAPLSALVEVK